jgi:hypothetical protein
MVSGDKDLMQLVGSRIAMYDPMPGDERWIGLDLLELCLKGHAPIAASGRPRKRRGSWLSLTAAPLNLPPPLDDEVMAKFGEHQTEHAPRTALGICRAGAAQPRVGAAED